MKKDGKQIKILICGHEIGGQMQLLAEKLRARGVHAYSVAFNDDVRDFRNDLILSNKKFPLRRFLFMIRAIFKYDVFHFFWGVSLMDLWKFHGIDLPVLKLLGKKIIVHFRGSDIINIRYYTYLYEKNRNNDPVPVPRIRPDQQAKLERWKKYADHILVSTPDLLEPVGGGAVLSPQVVDLTYWQNDEAVAASGGTIYIGHAPTRRTFKGTEFLIEAVEALKEKGYKVELKLIENIKQTDVKQLLLNCTIGVDQLLHGWYGKVSVEMMALGKPVVCYLNPGLTQGRPAVPIVNATPDSLLQTLETLLADRAKMEELSKAGIAYARQYHDVEKIIDQLLVIYGITKQ